MIDFRLKTFLDLCETESYTKTAKNVCITQPAVSQHVQFLEKYYQTCLIASTGKQFALTDAGKELYRFAKLLAAESVRLYDKIQYVRDKRHPLRFGATLTIGEYTCPTILAKLIAEMPELEVAMQVNNTEILLNLLKDGQIDFALVEGYFSKDQFEAQIISNEPFIAVCSPMNEYADKSCTLEELCNQALIIREYGSGTRSILEEVLLQKNLSVASFKQHYEIGNMNTIKYLCHQNYGISFMYYEAAKKELKSGELKKIEIRDFSVQHPFSFVYLKNSPDQMQLSNWISIFSNFRI